MLSIIIKGQMEIGSKIPKKGHIVLINAPNNIRKIKSNPTLYKTRSILHDTFGLKIEKINRPGIKVKKKKPKIFLKNGIFKKTTKSVAIRKINTKNKVLLEFVGFTGLFITSCIPHQLFNP